MHQSSQVIQYTMTSGLVAELADAQHLKCCVRKGMRVRFPPGPQANVFRGVAQMARALALGARGRTFKSCRPDKLHILDRIDSASLSPYVYHPSWR